MFDEFNFGWYGRNITLTEHGAAADIYRFYQKQLTAEEIVRVNCFRYGKVFNGIDEKLVLRVVRRIAFSAT
jgi:hypothetical protein